MRVLSTLNAQAEVMLWRSAVPAAVLTVLCVATATLLGLGNISQVAISLMGFGVAVILSLSQDQKSRRSVTVLYLWSFCLRYVVLVALSLLLPYTGRAFLGSDAELYYKSSLWLAGNSLSIDVRTMAGSVDVGHIYLFALAIKLLGADLFGLKTVNVVLGSLSSSVVFLVARRLIPKYAVLAGVGVALFPSLVWLSSIDLLKDPSVMFAASLVALSSVMLLRGSLRSQFGYAMVGAIGLVGLRYTRFYVPAFFELAWVILASRILLRDWRLLARPRTARAIVLTVMMMVLAEVGPMILGQPATPQVIAFQTVHLLNTPEMRDQAQGTVESHIASDAQALNTPEMRDQAQGTVEPHIASDAQALITHRVFGVVRQLFGPFPWVLPEQWTINGILSADYGMYPGMVVWYLMIPFVVLGMITEGWRFFLGRRMHVGLECLVLALVLYFSVYFSIALSWRQRDVMIPLLVIVALVGAERSCRIKRWTTYYLVYGAGVFLFAVMHSMLRAFVMPH